MIARWITVMGLACCATASAAELERYPDVGDVLLPERGVFRIHVPPSLRSVDDPPDGSDFVLVNGAGEAVPVAVARNPSQGQVVEWSDGFRWRVISDPALGEAQYLINVEGRPLDYVQVELPAGGVVATVHVDERVGSDWVDTGATTRVWEQGNWFARRVRLPRNTGEYRLRLDYHRSPPTGTPELRGLRYAIPAPDPDRVEAKVQAWSVNERGWARYQVDLQRPLAVSRVAIHTDVDLFDREAAVVGVDSWDASADTFWNRNWNITRVQRLTIGGADVEQAWIDASDVRGDRMVVEIESVGEAALPIETVTVEVPGLNLVVRDPGVGPHKLYAGARIGTTSAWELQSAVSELFYVAETVVEVENVRANDAYRPPEVRGNLVGPGAEVSLRRMTSQHDIVGDPGLVRIPLSAEVLVGARSDLGDLRIIDPNGRQIPYLLRRRGGEHPLNDLTWERREDGSRSLIDVPLPAESLMLSSVTLSTDAPLFSRQITLFRRVGAELEPVRHFTWTGSDRPSQITLPVHQAFTDRLVIGIDNGDDPPLPITGVGASWPAWELVAQVPDSGARLVYGDRRLRAPEHDLALLRDEVGRRATRPVALGPAKAMLNPVSMFDSGVVLVGVSVLVIGLLGLILAVIVGGRDPKPDNPESTEPPPSANAEPAPATA